MKSHQTEALESRRRMGVTVPMQRTLAFPLALVFLVILGLKNSHCASQANVPTLRIALVYRGSADVAGQMVGGFEEAVMAFTNKHNLHTNFFDVHVGRFPYGTTEQGLDALIKLSESTNEVFDIVFGPTDSSVFVRALERFSANDSISIPVVSPIVAADVDLSSNRWFVQVNPDVSMRGQILAAQVAKLWPRSIGVLHSGTEFGRRSEAAFRQYLPPEDVQNYLPLQFESFDEGQKRPVAHDKIRLLLRERPEALGIFGSSEDIRSIQDLIMELRTSLTHYKPFLFTLLDIRSTGIEGLHFASTVQNTTSNNSDLTLTDGMGLSYDTASLIMHLILEKGVDDFRQNKPQFLDELWNKINRVTRIDGWDMKTTLIPGSKTDSAQEILSLYKIDSSGHAVDWIDSTVTPSVPQRIKTKILLIFGCFGWLPILYAGMIFASSLFLSFLDVKSWYQGSIVHILKPHTFVFCFFISTAVLCLYLYLCETRRVPYDSLIMALLIAVAPIAALRSSLFDTPAGRSFGAEALYSKVRGWVDKKIQRSRFSDYPKLENVLSTYNDLEQLRDKALQARGGTKERWIADERIQKIESQATEAETLIERKRVYARILLERFDWSQLTEMNLVPPGFVNPKNPGPNDVASKCVRRIEADRTLRDVLITEYEREMKISASESSKNHARIISEYKLNEDLTDYKRLVILMREFRITPNYLSGKNLLPKPWPPKLTTEG